MDLSYSRMDALQCLRRWRAKYILGAKEPDSPAGRLGLVVHAVMESVWRTVQTLRPVEIQWAWFSEALKPAWSKHGAGLDEAAHQSALEMLKGWHKRVGENLAAWLGTRVVMGVEQRFAVECSGEVVLRGYIDLMLGDQASGTVWVYDWKSGLRWATRDEVASDLQMDCYALAVRKMVPWAKRVVCVYEALRHGYSIESERDPQRGIELEEYMALTADAIFHRQHEADQEAAWSPTPSALCAYCAVQSGCPALELREQPAINEADPQAVAIERARVGAIMNVHKAQYERLGKVLREHILQSGRPVVAGGTSYSIMPNKRYQVTARKALPVLLDSHPGTKASDWLDGFIVDDARLRRLIDDDLAGPVGKELEKVAEAVVIGDKLQPRKAG